MFVLTMFNCKTFNISNSVPFENENKLSLRCFVEKNIQGGFFVHISYIKFIMIIGLLSQFTNLHSFTEILCSGATNWSKATKYLLTIT